MRWTAGQVPSSRRSCATISRKKLYNLHVRQLLHVGYKVASQMGNRWTDALERYEDVVADQVRENLLERHIKRVFFLGYSDK